MFTHNIICFAIPQTLKNTLDTSEHLFSLSQFVSTSNWQKNHTSYLKPNRILIEGGLALCAHTQKTCFHTQTTLKHQQHKKQTQPLPHILYSSYVKNQDVNEGTSWQMNGCIHQ